MMDAETEREFIKWLLRNEPKRKPSPPGPKYICKLCNTVIQSMYRHDFVTCKCGAVSIDGGSDYTKMSGNPENYETYAEVVLSNEGE